MATVVVTGAAGFIASRIAEMLLDGGWDVCGLDDLSAPQDPRLLEHRLARLRAFPAFRFERVDVSDEPAVRAVVASLARPPEGVVHLAAKAGVRLSVEQPTPYYRTNVLGTLAILEVARQLGIPKVVLASSSSVYGNHLGSAVREEEPCGPVLSPYAASKRAAEELSELYDRLHGVSSRVIRYFTVYGPAGRPDMSVFRFVQSIMEGRVMTILGDGHQRRDFSYVDDIARGTIAALGSASGGRFNLSGGGPVELREVVEMIEAESGKRALVRYEPAHPADPRETWADISRSKASLGWEPQVEVREGIRRTVSWYRANRTLTESL